METKSYKTIVVVQEWKNDLLNEGYQLAYTHYYFGGLRELVYINTDEQEIRYLWTNFGGGVAWLENRSHHRIRNFEYEKNKCVCQTA